MRDTFYDQTRNRCNEVPGHSRCQKKITSSTCLAEQNCVGHTHNPAAAIEIANNWREEQKEKMRYQKVCGQFVSN